MDLLICDESGERFDTCWPLVPRVGEVLVLDQPFEMQKARVVEVRYHVREKGSLAFVEVKIERQ